MKNTIKNLLVTARIKSINDSGDVPRVTVDFLGNEREAFLLIPYGDMQNATLDSTCFLFAVNGKASNLIAIPTDPINRILKDLQPGEKGIGNFITKDHILFSEDGKIQVNSESGSSQIFQSDGTIDINSSNDTINASGTVNVTINLNVTQTINCANIVAGNAQIAGRIFLNHAHSGVQSGASNTGGVV